MANGHITFTRTRDHLQRLDEYRAAITTTGSLLSAACQRPMTRMPYILHISQTLHGPKLENRLPDAAAVCVRASEVGHALEQLSCACGASSSLSVKETHGRSTLQARHTNYSVVCEPAQRVKGSKSPSPQLRNKLIAYDVANRV